jgi:hypothetical protein
MHQQLHKAGNLAFRQILLLTGKRQRQDTRLSSVTTSEGRNSIVPVRIRLIYRLQLSACSVHWCKQMVVH